MDLLKDIKKKRAEQRQKKPFRRNVFNQISSIVKRYGLNNDFLSILDNVDDYLAGQNLKFSRIKVKAFMENYLFSLATKDDYTVAMSIVSKIDNPYLKFAHSPEEFILCEPLYRLNPSIDSKKLIRYHFETLYLHELAKLDRMKPNKKDDET